MPTTFSPKSAIWTRSLVYAIYHLWIESPEEAYCLLVHGEYQRVRRYRPYRRDAPTPLQAPVPLHLVHVGERIRECPQRVPVIRAHLAPHHVGGVEGHPVRDACRSACKHVVDMARLRFIPPSGIWNLPYQLNSRASKHARQIKICG